MFENPGGTTAPRCQRPWAKGRVGQDAYAKQDYRYLRKYKKNNLEKWLGYSFMLLPQINIYTIAKIQNSLSTASR